MTTKEHVARANGLFERRAQLQLDRRRLIDGIKQLNLDGSQKLTQAFALYHMDKYHTHERVMKAALHNLREAHAENCIPMANPVRVAYGPATAAGIYERYTQVRKTINDGKPVTIVKNGKSPVRCCEAVLGNVPREIWATWDAKKRQDVEDVWVDYMVDLAQHPDALLSVVIQYDEQNVHAQGMFIPVVWSNTAHAQAGRQAEARGEDREAAMPYSWQLNAKAYDGETKVASRVARQTHYWETVKRFGFARGESAAKTGAKQLPNKEYRKRVEGLCRELEKVIVQSEQIDRETGAELKASVSQVQKLEHELAAALGDQQEAIRLLWETERRKIAEERAEEKRKAKEEGLKEVQAATAGDRAQLVRDRSKVDADRSQLDRDIATHAQTVAGDRAVVAEATKARTDLAALQPGLAAAQATIAQAGEIEKKRLTNLRRAKDIDSIVEQLRAQGIEIQLDDAGAKVLNVARATKIEAAPVAPMVAAAPVAATPATRRPQPCPAPKKAVEEAKGPTYAEQKRAAEKRREEANEDFDLGRRLAG